MPTELEKNLPKTMLTTLTELFHYGENRTIRNIITILFVFAMEALITTEGIFECPVESHARYGWVFIFIPALILALLSVMLSEDFLKLMQGVCYREVPRKQGRKCFIPCGWPKWSIVRIGDSKFFVVVYNGLAAASLWIFWAFLQGRYYVCAKEGNKESKLRPFKDNKNETYRIEQLFIQAKSKSQIIGFALIAVWVVFCTLVLTIHKCCYKRPVSSIQSPEEFLDIEEEEAVKTYKDKVEELAKKRGKNKAEKMFQEDKRTSKSPTEMLKDVYNKFKNMSGYEEAFAGDFDEEAAAQHRKAFDEKQKAQAKADIDAMLKQSPAGDGDTKDDYFRTEDAFKAMSEEFPRAVGDHSKPYVVKSQKTRDDMNVTNEEGDHHELQPLTT